MLLIFLLIIFITAVHSDRIGFSCVNPAEHGDWKTPLPSRRTPVYGCALAIHGLQRQMKSVLSTNLTFYSSISSPAQAMETGTFALPFYVQSSTSISFLGRTLFFSIELMTAPVLTANRTPCVAAIRMRYDFSPDSLPLLNKTFLATDGPIVTQNAKWSDFVLVLEHLQSICVAGLRQPAWAALGQIVVALWGAGSTIDQHEGLNRT